MVAVIKTGHSIHRVVNYNEQKVKEGKAECIAAVNYPMDVEDLTFQHKLNRLLKQASLNENVTRNSVHISLNFSPSESLPRDELKEIADLYMEKIGFVEQPYLVYQHHDAGHPHIHIASVKVRADGSRIDMQNIGRNQSEKARKEIEKKYYLKKAEEAGKQGFELKPIPLQIVQYGKSDSRRAIATVLDAVLNRYKYTSLHELNAVLNLYHVQADRGRENSRMFAHKGLMYRILDGKGNPVGVPIKASSFYNKPTLKYLAERFALNQAAREPHKARVKNAIDLALIKEPNLSIYSLMQKLEKVGIDMVFRQNAVGFIYGITYVDHQTKCIFNGSDLGKAYSAKGLQERCTQNVSSEQRQEWQPSEKHVSIEQPFTKQYTDIASQHLSPPTGEKSSLSNIEEPSLLSARTTALDILFQSPTSSDPIPIQLRKKERRKKKKHISKDL